MVGVSLNKQRIPLDYEFLIGTLISCGCLFLLLYYVLLSLKVEMNSKKVI